MFKRKNRLVPGVRFANSYQLSAPELILKEKRNGLDLNRFGIVVSKKIDKRAVGRNKIKRIFRSSLSDLCKKMSVGHDILFITRLGIVGKTKKEIQSLIEEILLKAGLIKK